MIPRPYQLATLALLIALVAATAFVFLSGAGSSAESGRQDEAVAAAHRPPSIRVAAANMYPLSQSVTVSGTIVARQEAAAGTDLGGLTITRLEADEGDYVKQGDVLCVLDPSALETQLTQADASRAQARANIAQAQAQIRDAEVSVRQARLAHERARQLEEKGVVTKAHLDQALDAHDSAEARLLSTRRALAAAEAQLHVIVAQRRSVLLQLEKTKVKAPADGLVLAREATLGGIVSAGSGPLFRIAVNGEFELAATASEADLAKLRPGMPVTLRVAGMASTIDGVIRRVSPEVDRTSRLGRLYVSLAQGAELRAGNFARGRVVVVQRHGLAVPATALVYRDKDVFVQKVVDGRVSTIPVSTGIREGALVEITQGLAEGEQVVARAATFVADGDAITPVPGEMMGALEP